MHSTPTTGVVTAGDTSEPKRRRWLLVLLLLLLGLLLIVAGLLGVRWLTDGPTPEEEIPPVLEEVAPLEPAEAPLVPPEKVIPPAVSGGASGGASSGDIDVVPDQAPESVDVYPWNMPGPDLDCVHIGAMVPVSPPDYHNLDRDGNGWGCESYG